MRMKTLFRSIVGSALIVLVLAFTLYLIFVMRRRIEGVVLKRDYQKVFLYELALCGILLAGVVDVRTGFLTFFRMKPLYICGWLLRVAVIAIAACALFLGGRVVAGGFINTEGPAQHAIVLGLALQDGQPTRDLNLRLDAARGYLDKYPEARLILTGGNGQADGTGKTEAAVMRDLLTAGGTPESRLVLEDQAETTKDNFINTARMIDPTLPVVLITSDYHMDRSARTAKDAGFQHVLRLPAPSNRFEYGANVLWEILMEMDDLLSRLSA